MARTYTNVTAGSALGFKVGSQSTLNTMIANHSGTDGIFYLTQDSHRLYVGTANGYIVPVNEGIESLTSSALSTEVANWTPADKEAATGSFYYLSDTNTLAVFNGQEWVEVNTDSWKDISTQTYSASAANDVATISNTIQVVKRDANDTASTNDHQVTDSFTITGANGIGVTASGKNVTLTGDSYTLSGAASSTSNAAEIQLNSTNTANDSAVTIVGGTNTVGAGATDTSITVTQSGDTITLRAANDFATAVALSSESNGFGVQATRKSGATTAKSTVDPLITVINDASDSTSVDTIHFQSGTATLNVYSKSVIDGMLQGLNAMHYRGTFGTNGGSSGVTTITYNGSSVTVTPSTATFSIGDTLLYAGSEEQRSYGSTQYKIGSLLIAQSVDGTEDANGVIPAAKLRFDVVQEQFGSDTTYTFGTNGAYGIGLQPSVNGAGQTGVYAVTPATGGLINIAVTDGTAGTGTSRTLALSHADITTTATTGVAVTQQLETDLTVPIITAISTDGKGHVDGITTTDYTFRNTQASVDQTNTTVTTSASNNVGVVTTTVALNHGGRSDSKSLSYEINSSSLTITDGDNATASRQGLTIDMVWGSF